MILLTKSNDKLVMLGLKLIFLHQPPKFLREIFVCILLFDLLVYLEMFLSYLAISFISTLITNKLHPYHSLLPTISQPKKCEDFLATSIQIFLGCLLTFQDPSRYIGALFVSKVSIGLHFNMTTSSPCCYWCIFQVSFDVLNLAYKSPEPDNINFLIVTMLILHSYNINKFLNF